VAFQPASNCWEVVLAWTTEGNSWKNVLHITATGVQELPVPTSADADELFTRFGNIVVPLLTTATTLHYVQIKDIRSDEGVTVTSVAAPVSGQYGSSPVPLNVALAVTLQSAVGGKSGRGRLYLTGFAEDLATSRLFSAGTALTLIVGLNGIQEDLALLHNYGFAVLSRFYNKVPRLVALPRLVTAFVMKDLRLDSQRRRLGR
jgi:hypothetical protein